MDVNELLKLLLAGGIAVIIREIVVALKARAESDRADDNAHVQAADAISETSVEMLKATVEQYEIRLAYSDKRLAKLEQKCDRYEAAFEVMRLDLISARQTIAQLELANGELRKRVRHLEEENAELRKRLDEVQQK